MAYHSRSPRVVGAHFFARYGYKDALMQAAAKSSENPQERFWHDVMDIIENMQKSEEDGKHPCAALPPKMS
ncbi:MAG: hypothetical protein HWE30_15075 [Methylocystaceae bacterium]|nr:hypothetical protein [Methylocystaceae bacterium]